MADELESWFRQLPFAFRREFVAKFHARVEAARAKLEDAAPVVKPENVREHVIPGALKATVKVRRKRHELDLEIVAGGPETTKQIQRTARYKREVKIGSGDTANIARDPRGAGVTYDYALAGEFGTEHQSADPWFYATWGPGGVGEETMQGINDDADEILARL